LLARRWSKVMLALFAVGVVTGTILSFELGLLWPNFMARSETSSDSGSPSKASRLRRGDLHRDLHLWLGQALAACALPDGGPDRDQRLHRLLDGDRRLTLDESPDRLQPRERACRRRPPVVGAVRHGYFWHELVHMYLAAYMVAGFITASVYAWAWLRGRRGRYERMALVIR